MAVQLKLGTFQFLDTEIPERITFGGSQRLAVHDLVGGARVIDAMGPSEEPLAWSGLFRGPNAQPRARYIDTLRRIGKPLTLTWSGLSYQVIIEKFRPDFERFYQIPYSISCEVVQNLNAPVKSAPPPSIDQAIARDMKTASGLVGLLGNTGISSAFAAVQSAIGAVSTFANAAKSVINSVLQPIAAMQQQVTQLIASTNNALQLTTTLGGVLPYNPVSISAFNLTSQINSFNSLPTLINLNTVMGRIGTNVGTVAPNVQTVTQAGGNMYQLASSAYGDPSSWTTIARANGLNDPVLAGINTIKIPPISDLAGGILGP